MQVNSKDEKRYFVIEVFHISHPSLSALKGYRLTVNPRADINTIGGKFAYQLQRRLNLRWAWSREDSVLCTDGTISLKEIDSIIKVLWGEQQAPFGHLRNITIDTDWIPSAFAQSEFAVMGLLRPAQREVQRALESRKVSLAKDVDVFRDPDVRPLVVSGKPAVSLSIRSHLYCRRNLQDFLLGKSSDEILDLMVTDIGHQHASFVEEIVSGMLAVHRRRLLAFNPKEETRRMIEQGADDVEVIRVRTGHEYPATALHPIVTTSTYKMFGVDGRKARNELVLPPDARAGLLKEAKRAFNQQPSIKDLLRDPLNSRVSSELFLDADALGFENLVRVGGSHVVEFDHRRIFNAIKQFGCFRKPDHQQPLRIGLVSFAKQPSWENEEVKLLKMLHEVENEALISGRQTLKNSTRRELEGAVVALESISDVLLLLLSEGEDIDEGDEGTGAYVRFKECTIPRDLPSQAVYLKTMRKDFALENLVLGILAKTGTAPFVLAKPLPYADVVVGLDIARRAKGRLAGSINAAATARIYTSDGQFLKYWIPDHQIEGETIPREILERMFSPDEFKGKRVLIQRDGRFRGDEKEALIKWADDIQAKFLLMEVIKSGSPRLYEMRGNNVSRPPKGICFRLSDREAFLVSSLPPFSDATPQPLQVRCDGSLSIEQACHSILALSLVHIGSKLAPRLPVTIHFADQIAELALKGIKPKSLEGTLPYWL